MENNTAEDKKESAAVENKSQDQAEGLLPPEKFRGRGIILLVGGIAAAVVFYFVASVLTPFLRIPFTIIAAIGFVAAYFGLWMTILGKKSRIFLDSLTGKIKPLGCIFALGLGIIVLILIIVIINAST